MLENLPSYISLIFGLTSIAALLLFVWAIKKSPVLATQQKAVSIMIGLTVWLLLQAALTLKNIYNSDFNSFPPKFLIWDLACATSHYYIVCNSERPTVY